MIIGRRRSNDAFAKRIDEFRPSRWVLTDPEQRIAAQFTQKALAKLANPLYRVALAMLDADGRETYRLVDARTNLADRIMVAPGEWAIVQDDKPVAKLVSLPRHEDEPRKGLLGVLQKVFAASDHGIVSAGAEHVLEPPVALGTYLLHRELTDSSVGE